MEIDGKALKNRLKVLSPIMCSTQALGIFEKGPAWSAQHVRKTGLTVVNAADCKERS